MPGHSMYTPQGPLGSGGLFCWSICNPTMRNVGYPISANSMPDDLKWLEGVFRQGSVPPWKVRRKQSSQRSYSRIWMWWSLTHLRKWVSDPPWPMNDNHRELDVNKFQHPWSKNQSEWNSGPLDLKIRVSQNDHHLQPPPGRTWLGFSNSPPENVGLCLN